MLTIRTVLIRQHARALELLKVLRERESAADAGNRPQ